jgi:two-component sensor histidine kinase
MAPYHSTKRDGVSIESDDIELDDRGATPVALIVHELATYGALREETGHVKIRSTLESDQVAIARPERGGPAVTQIPAKLGFLGADSLR